MTLQELRDKINATKAELRTLLPTAETDEQRTAVTTLETRLDAEEAELTAAETWDTAQQRLQSRLTTETLTEQAPRRQTQGSEGSADGEVRERGEIVLTREFIGDMLNSREREWDAEYRSRPRSVVDKEISRAMLRTDSGDAMYRPSAEAPTCACRSQYQYDHGRPWRLPNPSGHRRLRAIAAPNEGVLRLRARGDGPHPFQRPRFSGPQLDRTGEAGESLGEGAPATAQGDLALTQVILKSNRVSSKSLQVPASVLRSFAVEAEPSDYERCWPRARAVGRRRSMPTARARPRNRPALGRLSESPPTSTR